MRNSVWPIPWTHRDSRPKSQAELDQEEQFDIYKAKHLAVPRHLRTDLDRLLDHYQVMMTRMIEDPSFVHQINLETDYYTREAQKRTDEGARLAHLRKKPLYKKGAEPREPPEPKPEPKPWARKVDPEPPPPYFEHLNKIHEPAPRPTRQELIASAVYEMRAEMAPVPLTEGEISALFDPVRRRMEAKEHYTEEQIHARFEEFRKRQRDAEGYLRRDTQI